MYFPILRGRQFELLALRECVNQGLLSNKIIPIVEPVKVSSTYTKTVDSFIKAGKSIAIIRNPQVGSWVKDLKKESNAKIREQANEQLKDANVISSFYVTPKLSTSIELAAKNGISIESLLLLCNNPEYVGSYEEVIGDNIPLYNVIPDKGDFRRRIRPNRVMCEDHFPKQTRNIDYSDIETEFFSSDHLYYADDGYKGFSDYSVVGEEYSETGFAPYAVAIHMQYLEKLNTEMSKSLRRSDSTLDYVPTQYIVDFIKSIEHNDEQEYDGIEYNSTTNPGGYNLAIFNPDLFECVSVSVYDIEKLQYTSKRVL